ncbi:MAG: ATP-binding protein [Clostridia bacterium]|nr:ATP-binding protein [Clostridia bacterium]
MKYLHRALEDAFMEAQSESPATLLSGPRQVGKTTMLEHLMEGTDRKFVSLDYANNLNLARNDPDGFFQIFSPPVLVDEVQYAPGLFRQIKIIADKTHRNGDFWLTGSRPYELMNSETESLAGRISLLSMMPMSQSEIHGHENAAFVPDAGALMSRRCTKMLMPETFRMIFEGGMPKLVSGEAQNRNKFYDDYIQAYIEKDLNYLSLGIDGVMFSTFIKVAAAHIGQLVNVTNLAKEAEVNRETASKWLKLMEQLNIIFLLRPYSNGLLKRTIGTPKLYFHDTALAIQLMGWENPNVLQNCAMSGPYFENYVISEVYKSWINAGRKPKLNFFRDKDGNEIDLILEENACLHPLEIKKTATPSSDMISAFRLLKVPEAYTLGTGGIICNASELSAFDANNLIIPAYMI